MSLPKTLDTISIENTKKSSDMINTVSTLTDRARYDSLADFTDPVPIIPDNYLDSFPETSEFDLIISDDQTCEIPILTDEQIAKEFASIALFSTSSHKRLLVQYANIVRKLTQNCSHYTLLAVLFILGFIGRATITIYRYYLSALQDSWSFFRVVSVKVSVFLWIHWQRFYTAFKLKTFDFLIHIRRDRALCIACSFGIVVVASASGMIMKDHHLYVRRPAFPLVKTHVFAFPDQASVLGSDSNVEMLNSHRFHKVPVYNLTSELREKYEHEKAVNNSLRPMYSLPVNGILSSSFSTRWGAMHSGIDIAAPLGTPIVSVSDGVVIEAGPAAGFGMWVKVRAEDGTVNVYGHVNEIDIKMGDRVLSGQQIATVGNRGFATGPHLHFEVWIDGKWKVDPAQWLAERGVALNPYNPGI